MKLYQSGSNTPAEKGNFRRLTKREILREDDWMTNVNDANTTNLGWIGVRDWKGRKVLETKRWVFYRKVVAK